MIYVVIAFLWISICLYVITGGADFGAGIIELFSKKTYREKTKKIMSKSIAPIWEANHMWLIIAVVILLIIIVVLANYRKQIRRRRRKKGKRRNAKSGNVKRKKKRRR